MFQLHSVEWLPFGSYSYVKKIFEYPVGKIDESSDNAVKKYVKNIEKRKQTVEQFLISVEKKFCEETTDKHRKNERQHRIDEKLQHFVLYVGSCPKNYAHVPVEQYTVHNQTQYWTEYGSADKPRGILGKAEKKNAFVDALFLFQLYI